MKLKQFAADVLKKAATDALSKAILAILVTLAVTLWAMRAHLTHEAAVNVSLPYWAWVGWILLALVGMLGVFVAGSWWGAKRATPQSTRFRETTQMAPQWEPDKEQQAILEAMRYLDATWLSLNDLARIVQLPHSDVELALDELLRRGWVKDRASTVFGRTFRLDHEGIRYGKQRGYKVAPDDLQAQWRGDDIPF